MTTALLTPVFVVIAFAAFQAALWSHARTEVRVVAQEAAMFVARGSVGAGDARASVVGVLSADTDLRDVSVDVDDDGSVVTVHVVGSAPGIVRGTWRTIDVTAAVPLERWRS